MTNLPKGWTSDNPIHISKLTWLKTRDLHQARQYRGMARNLRPHIEALIGTYRHFAVWYRGTRALYLPLDLEGYTPDHIFNPCEYCREVQAQGTANGARVCLPCFDLYHGGI